MISTLTSALRRFTFADWAIACVPLVMVAGFYALRSQHRDAYYLFVKEDGPAETLQALCVLGASVTAAFTAFRLKACKQRVLALLMGGFALLTFVVFGEEISWGQRIFGWSSSEYFQSVNMQKETNLHNDVRLKYVVHPTLITAGLYATFSPLLHEALRRRRRPFATFFTTELPTLGFFAVFTGVYVIYEYLNPLIAPYYHGFDVILWQDLEMAESFLYAGVLGWTVLKLRGVRALFGEPSHAAAGVTSAPAGETARARSVRA